MDDSTSDEELPIFLCLVLHRRRRRKRRRFRRMWVRPIFTLRRQQGEYHNLLQELRLSDPDCLLLLFKDVKGAIRLSIISGECALRNV